MNKIKWFILPVLMIVSLFPTIKSYAINIDDLGADVVEVLREYDEQWGLYSSYHNDIVGFGDYLFGLREQDDYRKFLFIVQDNINTGIFYYMDGVLLHKTSYTDVEYVTVEVNFGVFYVDIHYNGLTDSYDIPINESGLSLWFDIDIVASNDSYSTGFKEGMNKGYNDGLKTGEYLGYNDGYGKGYNKGYNDGIEDEENVLNNVWVLFEAVLSSISNVFSTTIFPGVTIGTLFMIPISFAMFKWFLKLIK